MVKDKDAENKLGGIKDSNWSFWGKKLAQVKLPRLNAMAPK